MIPGHCREKPRSQAPKHWWPRHCAHIRLRFWFLLCLLRCAHCRFVLPYLMTIRCSGAGSCSCGNNLQPFTCFYTAARIEHLPKVMDPRMWQRRPKFRVRAFSEEVFEYLIAGASAVSRTSVQLKRIMKKHELTFKRTQLNFCVAMYSFRLRGVN
jgi:hypothetical protein